MEANFTAGTVLSLLYLLMDRGNPTGRQKDKREKMRQKERRVEDRKRTKIIKRKRQIGRREIDEE